MRRKVSSPDETPRRELKMRRSAEYFFYDELRGVQCLILLVSHIRILEEEIRDARISGFSPDFETLIKGAPVIKH